MSSYMLTRLSHLNGANQKRSKDISSILTMTIEDLDPETKVIKCKIEWTMFKDIRSFM